MLKKKTRIILRLRDHRSYVLRRLQNKKMTTCGKRVKQNQSQCFEPPKVQNWLGKSGGLKNRGQSLTVISTKSSAQGTSLDGSHRVKQSGLYYLRCYGS